MAAEVTREEFEARVSVLENEVEGEKMVTRHILEQTHRNGDDLAAVKTHLDRVERKVDGLDQKADRLEHKFNGLIHDLPKIVAEAVRDANRDLKK